jgi:hypothetical protein
VKKFARALPLLLLCVGFLMIALPVLAGIVSWSGRLENPDPVWDRVEDDCSGPSGYVEWYDVQPFYVDVTGDYTIEMTTMTGDISPDGFYALYDTSFDAASPAANCLQTDDDSGVGLAPAMTASLEAGRVYVLVTTQCCDGTDPGEEMDYTNEISGPGTVTLGIPDDSVSCTYPLPAGLAQGRLNRTVSALWAPDPSAETNVVLPGGSAWHVLQTEGDYAQLYIACEGEPVWVLRADLAPVS